jgi:hypothetical protein
VRDDGTDRVDTNDSKSRKTDLLNSIASRPRRQAGEVRLAAVDATSGRNTRVRIPLHSTLFTGNARIRPTPRSPGVTTILDREVRVLMKISMFNRYRVERVDHTESLVVFPQTQGGQLVHGDAQPSRGTLWATLTAACHGLLVANPQVPGLAAVARPTKPASPEPELSL